MPDHDETDEVFLPTAWADARPGPKHWTVDARGDDPAARVVHPPNGEGPGSGKAFLFLFGYKTASESDQAMLSQEIAEIGDDIATLRNAGYTVVVDRQAVREDLVEAVTGKGTGVAGLIPAGFYWSSHGNDDGSLECCDGAIVTPDDLDPAAVSPGLRLAVLGACYVGAYAPAWRTALGGHPLVAGWGQPVTLERAVDFLEADQPDVGLDDLIERWLLTDAPVPPSPDANGLPTAAVHDGRSKGLKRWAQAIGARLGAETEKYDSHYELTVPLPDGHAQAVRLFVVDGADPFTEGVRLCGMEAEVGPTSALITPEQLLGGSARPGYGRIALVSGTTGMPLIVAQSFTPLAGASAQYLTAHCYQVARQAYSLRLNIFGDD